MAPLGRTTTATGGRVGGGRRPKSGARSGADPGRAGRLFACLLAGPDKEFRLASRPGLAQFASPDGHLLRHDRAELKLGEPNRGEPRGKGGPARNPFGPAPGAGGAWPRDPERPISGRQQVAGARLALAAGPSGLITAAGVG